MKPTRVLAATLLAPFVLAQTPATPDWDTLGSAWWAHVQYLASDELQGRLPGTPGFELATQYVVKQFTAIGLKPAGGDGYLQPIMFSSTKLDADKSLAELKSGTTTTPLKLGSEITLGTHVTTTGDSAEIKDAPLVFIGYGLRLPTRHMDDYASLDLHGKVVVFYNSAPARLQGPQRAYARVAGQRWKYLKAAGAIGMIAITPPRVVATAAAPQTALVNLGPAPRGSSGSAATSATAEPARASSGASHPPAVLYKPMPAYTAEATAQHIEGNVTLRVHVGANSSVVVLGVVRGLGHGLDESATDAAQKIRFKPATDASGNSVDWEGPINIVYKIDDTSAAQPPAQSPARPRAEAPPARPSMGIADPTLDTLAGLRLNATVPTAQADAILAGTGHTMAELKPLVDAGKPLPAFDMHSTIHAITAVTQNPPVATHNVVGLLEGSDSKLKHEYIVISAHLDHLGVGRPVKGDAIYNGAMDNASGVASVIEVAKLLSTGPRPQRSILFIALTGEEMGELGSAYFAAKPTVKKSDIVADLNMDMYLPLFPLRYLEVQGLAESTLGNDARAIAQLNDIEVQFDKQPDENRFIRSDQVNFVAQGIPALAFKFGWTPDSPEMKTFNDWVKTRYHQPSDDLDQPIDKAAAAQFDAFLAQLAVRVANTKDRPSWYPESSFAHQ